MIEHLVHWKHHMDENVLHVLHSYVLHCNKVLFILKTVVDPVPQEQMH